MCIIFMIKLNPKKILFKKCLRNKINSDPKIPGMFWAPVIEVRKLHQKTAGGYLAGLLKRGEKA